MRQRDRVLVGGALALAAVITAASFLVTRDRPPPAQPDAFQTEAAAPRGPSTDPALLEAPFDTVRPQLEASASRGDARAAYRLGTTIAGCMHYKPMTDTGFDRLLSQAAAAGGEAVRIGARALGDDETIDMLLYAHGETTRLCADTEALRQDPPTRDAFHWIALAAERGHPPAMAVYGQHAFAEFATDADLVENAVEVARRRERAKAFLDSAMTLGEPAAFVTSAGAHAAEGWLTPDPQLAYTHLLVYLQTQDGRKMPPSLRRTVEETYVRGLTPPARRQAQADAAALVSQLPPTSESSR